MTTGPFHPQTLAGMIHAARLARDLVPAAACAGLEPSSVAEAYAVQEAFAGLVKDDIAGWKVSVTPHGPVAAPIFRRDVRSSGDTWPAFGHPVTIEVEIAFRLRSDITPEMAGDPAAIKHAIAGVMIGLEVVAGGLEASQFLMKLADRLDNAGYITGAIGSGIPDGLDQLRCQVRIDGAVTHDFRGGHVLGDPLAPLLAVAATDLPLGGFRSGQFVTTGALCGFVSVSAGSRIDAEIDGIGAVVMQA